MNRDAVLTWGAIAASVALVVAAQFKKPQAPVAEPAAPPPAPAAADIPNVPMAEMPAGTKGIHLTDQGLGPEPAADDPAALARTTPHRYLSVANGEFSYAREPSDDERSRGVASMRPLKVRYLGRTATGMYGFTSTSIGAYRYLWCNDPCTVMQAGFAGGGRSYQAELDARYPSVLHDVYLDASAGRLDFAISRASP